MTTATKSSTSSHIMHEAKQKLVLYEYKDLRKASYQIYVSI